MSEIKITLHQLKSKTHVLNEFYMKMVSSYMGYFQKVRRKCFFLIAKNDIYLCKLGNILILFNSKQTKEAGRAFKSKYDHLI